MEASLLRLLRWESEGWNPWHSIKTRCWFQRFFIFIPIWGNDPIWLRFFKRVAQPPTRKEGEKRNIIPSKEKLISKQAKEKWIPPKVLEWLGFIEADFCYGLYHGKPPSFTTIWENIFGSLFSIGIFSNSHKSKMMSFWIQMSQRVTHSLCPKNPDPSKVAVIQVHENPKPLEGSPRGFLGWWWFMWGRYLENCLCFFLVPLTFKTTETTTPMTQGATLKPLPKINVCLSCSLQKTHNSLKVSLVMNMIFWMF